MPKSFNSVGTICCNRKNFNHETSLHGKLYPASTEQLLEVEGGGFLTGLTSRLSENVTEVVDVVKSTTTVTGSFLKTLVDILV